MSPRTSTLDLDAAAAFLATVPEGHWTSYGDVAVAAGRSSSAAQGVASWIGSKGHRLKNVHRVLNGDGEISAAWTPAGEGLPYERERPGELIHFDVKKLGRIQGGAGKRVTGRARPAARDR